MTIYVQFDDLRACAVEAGVFVAGLPGRAHRTLAEEDAGWAEAMADNEWRRDVASVQDAGAAADRESISKVE